MASLKLRPTNLDVANAFVSVNHRHHKPVVGAKFAISALDGVVIVGVAIVGRPVSRGCSPYTAEVTRLCTDGTHNACSFLYSACARACAGMGYTKIQTYILRDEDGTSLKAAGWVFETWTAGGDWNDSKSNAGTRRTDQPQGRKQRWAKKL